MFVFAATVFWALSATLARFVFRDRHVDSLVVVELRLAIATLVLLAILATARRTSTTTRLSTCRSRNTKRASVAVSAQKTVAAKTKARPCAACRAVGCCGGRASDEPAWAGRGSPVRDSGRDWLRVSFAISSYTASCMALEAIR